MAAVGQLDHVLLTLKRQLVAAESSCLPQANRKMSRMISGRSITQISWFPIRYSAFTENANTVVL